MALSIVLVAALWLLTHATIERTSRAALERAVDVDLAGLVDIYASGGETELARRISDRLALVPRDGNAAHYLLALVLRDVQNQDGAIAALEEAVRLSPTLTPAREELADLYRERGRPVDELLQLQALSTGDPDPARGLSARSSAGPEIWRVENNLGEDVPLGLDAFRNTLVEKPEEPPAPAAEAPAESPPALPAP